MDPISVGLAGVVLAGLTYFAGVQRGKALQRRAEEHAEQMRDQAWERDDRNRNDEESQRRVRDLVMRVESLLTPAGGNHGPHLETVQEAGIRALSDGEIRLALRQIAERTRIKLPDDEWPQLEAVDLKKVFTACHQRINLSGGPPTLVRIVGGLKSEGIDVARS